MAVMSIPSQTLRDTVLIHWRGDTQPLDWLRIDGSGRAGPAVRESAPPASVLSAARQVIVLAPSESITLLVAQLPARNAEQARQAAPFVVEEQLAGNVESLHFAVAAKAPGQWWVAAVDPQLLRGWMSALAARGVLPDRIVPDVMALAAPREGSVVLVDGERALVRLQGDRAFALDAELLDSVLPEDGRSVREQRVVEAGTTAVAALAAGAGRAAELNLLAGDFAQAHRGADLRERWRRIGWVALAALVLATGYLKLDQWRLDQRATALDAEMVRIYRAQFPDARNVPNPLAQMRNALNAANGGVGAESAGLHLLALSAPVLASQSRVALRGAEYRSGALSLRLSAPSIEALDALRESLGATPGLNATLENAENADEGVDGRIKLDSGA